MWGTESQEYRSSGGHWFAALAEAWRGSVQYVHREDWRIAEPVPTGREVQSRPGEQEEDDQHWSAPGGTGKVEPTGRARPEDLVPIILQKKHRSQTPRRTSVEKQRAHSSGRTKLTKEQMLDMTLEECVQAGQPKELAPGGQSFEPHETRERHRSE